MKRAFLILVLALSLAGNIDSINEFVRVNKKVETQIESEQVVLNDSSR